MAEVSAAVESAFLELELVLGDVGNSNKDGGGTANDDVHRVASEVASTLSSNPAITRSSENGSKVRVPGPLTEKS